MLALTSGLVTQCNAAHTKDREIALQRLRQKQEFIDTFTTKIERYLELTLSIRKREIFLREWQSDPERTTVRYPDGRNFDETRAKWEDDKRYWVEHSPGSAMGLIYTAEILFREPRVRSALEELEKATESYSDAEDYQQLMDSYSRTISALQKTALTMAAESQ